MTADVVATENVKKETESGVTETNQQIEQMLIATVVELPREILDIFTFLSFNDKIVFKSQQIDDPELEQLEKFDIAKNIYEKNRHTFLMRFGSYFLEEHLETFARLAISDAASPIKQDENCDEMQFMLHDYQRKLHTRKQDVKNRRYAAMQQLIKQGEYFSEQEMMKRAPELYQELIGQYLSEREKKQRDSYDVKNTTFSSILMHTLEQEQMEKVLKQANEHIQDPAMEDEDVTHTFNAISFNSENSASMEAAENLEIEVPASYRQQWGNFDNVQIPCTTSQPIKRKPKPAPIAKRGLDAKLLITAGERDLFRQEFIDIMHEQFLAGNEADFDYSQVDDNAELDDLHQLNQDREDAYFEASDDDDIADGAADIKRGSDEESEDGIRRESDEESEDELDIYMNHLSQHHSLQK